MAKVLIATNDSGVLDTLAAEIQGEGHDVQCAADGQEAYAQVLGSCLDLIILDPALPVFDGYETCRILRDDPDVPEGIPILFLTTADTDRRSMERVGGTDSLPKQHETWQVRELLTKYA